MEFFAGWLRNLGEFLFPRNEKTIELENLSTEEMFRVFPRAKETSKDTHAIFDYGHPLVKEMVWEIKYNGNKSLAKKVGEILFDTIHGELEERGLFEKWTRPIILPIPISDKRRFERGWNQSEILVEAIKKSDQGRTFKYLMRHLVKIRHTESQTKTTNREERLNNINNTMKILNKETVKDECLIVVDDVTTTGSTFAEARRVLKEAGAKKIIFVALAH